MCGELRAHAALEFGVKSRHGQELDQQTPAPVSSRSEIETFLERVRALGPSSAQGTRGRLIFALDATMSRQPTWDTACTLQADMFREAAASAGSIFNSSIFVDLTNAAHQAGFPMGSNSLT